MEIKEIKEVKEHAAFTPVKRRPAFSGSNQSRQLYATIDVNGTICGFPESPDLENFWNNLKNGRNCIPVPPARWNLDGDCSEDKNEPIKTCSVWIGVQEYFEIKKENIIYFKFSNFIIKIEFNVNNPFESIIHYFNNETPKKLSFEYFAKSEVSNVLSAGAFPDNKTLKNVDGNYNHNFLILDHNDLKIFGGWLCFNN